MKFQIVYDKPGRIRFRCGAYAFDKELETAVQKQLLESAAVKKVEAHAENGGILVYYEAGARQKVSVQLRHWTPDCWHRWDRTPVRNGSIRTLRLI